MHFPLGNCCSPYTDQSDESIDEQRKGHSNGYLGANRKISGSNLVPQNLIETCSYVTRRESFVCRYDAPIHKDETMVGGSKLPQFGGLIALPMLVGCCTPFLLVEGDLKFEVEALLNHRSKDVRC